MANLYNIIEFLCMRDGIKPGRLCAEVGISRGVLSDLKSGRSKSLSLANMQKIANYFQVSTDIFNEGIFEETLPNTADMFSLRDIFLKDTLFNKTEKSPTPDGGGLHKGGMYDLLNQENRAIVDALIEKLLKSQSDD